jgi:hypothetical protein
LQYFKKTKIEIRGETTFTPNLSLENFGKFLRDPAVFLVIGINHRCHEA